jgi:hypothetical protein
VTVAVGVDIGNATTETVLLEIGATPAPRVLGAASARTRGRKGSPESLAGAAALVRRMLRALGHKAEVAVVAPLRAVDTLTTSVSAPPSPTGRLRLVAAAVETPGGTGACVGPPLVLGDPGKSPEPSC